MHAKLDAVLSRHKFQPFKDVMAAEVRENEDLHPSPITTIHTHVNEPVHAVAQIAKGRR
jgi:hypothetical protein